MRLSNSVPDHFDPHSGDAWQHVADESVMQVVANTGITGGDPILTGAFAAAVRQDSTTAALAADMMIAENAIFASNARHARRQYRNTASSSCGKQYKAGLLRRRRLIGFAEICRGILRAA
jgi:hypothetical protein